MRRHWLRTVRWGVAAFAFAGLTAAFVDFRGLVPAALAHWLGAVQWVPAMVALATGASVSLAGLAILAVTLGAGRLYCSALCPLGIFQDVVARLAHRLPGRHRRLAFRPAQTGLRHLFLWTPVAGIAAGWAGLTLSLFDPFSIFGRIAVGLFRPVVTVANNLLVGMAEVANVDGLYRFPPQWAGVGALAVPAAMLLLVAGLAAFRGRLYCNTVCPVGTLLGLVARRAAWRLEIDLGVCRKCGDCVRACKAQCIDLRSGGIDFSRCVACYNCVSACDETGIHYRRAWGRRPAPARPPSPRPPLAAACENAPRREFLAATGTALLAAATARADSSEPARASSVATTGPMPGHEASRAICPPGASTVSRFLDRCTACQLCIAACPTHVLQPSFLEYGWAGWMKPRLDCSVAFCNFDCRRCAEVCPDGALTLLPLAEKQVTRLGIARLDLEKCVVKALGKDCAACSEHCPTKAVDTVPYGNNLRLPQMHDAHCIGCGACEFACPVRPQRAIVVHGHRRHDRAQRRQEKRIEPSPAGTDFPF